MKKLFTMTLVAMMAMSIGADAQNYRKWDFTNWSAQTVANLAAEAEAGGVTGGSWSDTEKANGDNPQIGKCYWSYANNVSEDGYLMANGGVIPETEGLAFNTAYTSRRSLAIAVDYSSTSLGEYAGPQYLWLGGGNAKSASARLACFTIPKVRIGQKISITAESHKPSDARGVALFAGDCTNDEFQIGEQFKPTTQETYTWEEGWELPAGAADNGDGTVDVVVYNTNGCHLYFIEVGDSDEKASVAWLYGGAGGVEGDNALAKLGESDKFSITPIEANKAFTLADLQDYDAMVVSSTVDNDEAIASLKAIRPFIPTLSLNPSIAEAWEMGKIESVEGQFLNVLQPNNALFRNLELIDGDGVTGLRFTDAESIQGIALTGKYADDAVLAQVMDSETTAIHIHSANRNAYLYLPYTQVAVNHGADVELLKNAITVVANTKAKVAQAPAPIIAQEYKNRQTTVTLRSSVPFAEIYYTIDGAEPTEASTLYTEPFDITSEGVTVKAVTRGEGYLMSEVAEQTIVLKDQAAAPTITANGSLVTITSEVEGAAIYYNFNGSNDVAKSAQYSEPFALKKSRTVYAFVVAEGFINSEVASAEVTVEGTKSRTNILSHMDSSSEVYNGGSTSTAYYFSWGKQKADYPYYNLDSRTEEAGEPDPETGDESIIISYTELNPEEEKDFENGWMIRSRGQVVDWENLSTGTSYGNHDGYNYASPEDDDPDFPATKGVIVLADKNTEPSDVTVPFPYSAYIINTSKFKGPFDIVANIGSIVKPTNNANHNIVLQVATDGNAWDSNWQTVGDTITISEKQRLTTNVVRSYNGGEEVYVRAYLCGGNSKVGFYDIYIANDPDEKPVVGVAGDVNEDGAVNVADISAIISVMAGTASYADADVNDDGSVNVADISAVISIMAE